MRVCHAHPALLGLGGDRRLEAARHVFRHVSCSVAHLQRAARGKAEARAWRSDACRARPVPRSAWRSCIMSAWQRPPASSARGPCAILMAKVCGERPAPALELVSHRAHHCPLSADCKSPIARRQPANASLASEHDRAMHTALVGTTRRPSHAASDVTTLASQKKRR